MFDIIFLNFLTIHKFDDLNYFFSPIIRYLLVLLLVLTFGSDNALFYHTFFPHLIICFPS
jgi:hypothetical protein